MPSPWPSPGFIRRLDGRLKLLLLVAACFVTQYVPAFWLPFWLAILACLFFLREMRSAEAVAMVRGGLYFAGFWLIMKTGSDALSGKVWADALLGALPLAGRLIAFAVIGMAFAGLASPLEIGRAAAWFMAPVAGKRAWKPALVIALTAWFLPLTLRLAGEVLAATRARGLQLSWRKKAVVICGTALRILTRKADELAVGLASRRLDDYRTWTVDK